MAPKAMKAGAKAMSKGGIADALATATQLKKSQCMKLLDSLATVATKEVKSTGKFTVPGLAMIKTRMKPATKAGKKEVFGKVMMVKAKPAKKIVKAYCVAALKKSI
jgi:nucleoid DNA-binding protein